MKNLGVNDLTDAALNVIPNTHQDDRYKLFQFIYQSLRNVFGINQEKELSIDISKDELIQILKNDPITRKMKLAESRNSIILRSKPSWQSWGEKIQIRFTEMRM